MLKAYAIGIVWRCYKFLTLQRQTLATMLPYLIPDVNGTLPSGGRMERDYSSLLPDYEEAIAQSLKQAPPPSYSMAMSVNGHVVLNGETSNVSVTESRPSAAETDHAQLGGVSTPPRSYAGAAASNSASRGTTASS